LQDTQVFRK